MHSLDGRDSSLQPLGQSAPKQQQAKPLRFVTNYGAPHPKRRRIGAACLTCRKRKTACSGERPYCETCKQNKLECSGYSSANVAPATGHKRGPSHIETGRDSHQHARKKSPLSPGTDRTGKTVRSRTVSTGPSPGPWDASSKPGVSSRDGDKPQQPLFSGPRNRMPYFRWLGPTAIMPGFKQMVVKVKRQDTDVGRASTDGGVRSPSYSNLQPNEARAASRYSATPVAAESENRALLALPFYDTSPMPPSELITHLANTFFTHVGCNYPFLQRERFMRDLEEKQVDAILVDAVCAIAARFSTHPLLTQSVSDGEKTSPAEYGHVFAQRAKTALPDTYACPSVAVAQAALLLAYIEFGEQRDSGLWMYLGISIRLAQDLGLHKLEGLRYIGKDGPTPKMFKRDSKSGSAGGPHQPGQSAASGDSLILPQSGEKEQTPEEQSEMEETKAVEQERVDTFWAIFFLDRVVSSGTGRRSTLRDKDIELSFPSASQTNGKSDWPAPFPALIRIVHLYGRVADLLNSIKEPWDITSETPKRLASMERQVTSFYQGLSPRLHFDAVNFQYYMKAGEGTNFVLLHFWFHTLIVLLHQPTLLKTFEGKMLQLFPNSQQLSMSSAKTIADILSYSQLMDAKAPLGNPFTTQPIYIAACAFLRETVEQTTTSTAQSRASSPSRGKEANADATTFASGVALQPLRTSSISTSTTSESPTTKSTPTSAIDHKTQLAKHTLLATAATQHYQLCYKALQSLETYWAGTKYILTVLNQKFEGVGDPLLYTVEEGESSMEQPRPEPAFTSPGWRRKLSWGVYASASSVGSTQTPFWPPKGFGQVPESSQGVNASKGEPMGLDEPPSQSSANTPYKAIGWTLTGTMDSSSANFAWHYASGNAQNPNMDPRLSSSNSQDHAPGAGQPQNNQYANNMRASPANTQQNPPHDRAGRPMMAPYNTNAPVISAAESESALNASSPFNQPGSTQAPIVSMPAPFTPQQHLQPSMAGPRNGVNMNGGVGQPYPPPQYYGVPGGQLPGNFMPGDMMIESQDVDMSMLGLDMMPWFDSYGTPGMMGMFDHNNQPPAGPGASGSAPPPG